uniref:Small ribosomal subunit protein uS8c n=1 Tax=Johansenicoccus eremophilus TaxID=3068301 RepID=A0AA49LLR2_9CHLO|nr:ribosomal protein S8 [Chlorophyceae sp. KF-2023a]
MVNDTISDMLTRIRNASMARKATVLVPLTKMNREIAKILEKEGFIQTFHIFSDSSGLNFGESQNLCIYLKYRSKQIARGKVKESCITNLKRISKSGLRIYSSHREIPRLLNGAGVVILSTPQGVMTDRDARAFGIGGELLCSVW